MTRATLTVDDPVLDAFAAEVGPDAPVTIRGGGTRWAEGGLPDPAALELRAPAGIVDHVPDEMIVRVRAGTPVAELHDALAAHRQTTALPERGGTVGGALMMGESGLHRLGRGHVREALLQARYVTAQGRLATVGGPTVKNVSGFDVCRLLVGSLGTLGMVGEVILRTRPIPPAAIWLRGDGVDPTDVRSRTRASAVLWDGTSTWVHLEGYASDVAAQEDDLRGRLGFAEDEGPPSLPPHRRSCTPAEAARLDPVVEGPFVVEIGVGTVHGTSPAPARPIDPGVAALNAAMRASFDPAGRCNPGRDPLAR